MIDLSPYQSLVGNTHRTNTKLIPAEKAIDIFIENSIEAVKLSQGTYTLPDDINAVVRRLFYRPNVFLCLYPCGDVFQDDSFLKEVPTRSFMAMDLDGLLNQMSYYENMGEVEFYLYTYLKQPKCVHTKTEGELKDMYWLRMFPIIK